MQMKGKAIMSLWDNLPREISAPMKGERIVFRVVAAETSNQYVEFDHYMTPGKGFSPTHMHEIQTQEWQIISGTATYVIDGVERTAQAGEKVVIPPRVFHIDPYNKTGSDQLHLLRKISPEGGSQLFFTTWFALACAESDDLTRPGYQFKPLPIAVIADALPAKSFTNDLPVWSQRLAIPIVALVGRLMGKRARYPELERRYFGASDK